MLGEDEYTISIFGTSHGKSVILDDRKLAVRSDSTPHALDGIQTTDPAFGLPAVWIDDAQSERARDSGYTLIDPLTVFITHLSEVIRESTEYLLTRNDVVQMLEGVRTRQSGLIEDLIPNIMSVADIQRVLQNLLAENVSIANIDLICETLVDIGRHVKDSNGMTEMVRQRMKNAICGHLKGQHDDLAVLSLDPRVEHQIASGVGGQRRNRIDRCRTCPGRATDPQTVRHVGQDDCTGTQPRIACAVRKSAGTCITSRAAAYRGCQSCRSTRYR